MDRRLGECLAKRSLAKAYKVVLTIALSPSLFFPLKVIGLHCHSSYLCFLFLLVLLTHSHVEESDTMQLTTLIACLIAGAAAAPVAPASSSFVAPQPKMLKNPLRSTTTQTQNITMIRTHTVNAWPSAKETQDASSAPVR